MLNFVHECSILYSIRASFAGLKALSVWLLFHPGDSPVLTTGKRYDRRVNLRKSLVQRVQKVRFRETRPEMSHFWGLKRRTLMG